MGIPDVRKCSCCGGPRKRNSAPVRFARTEQGSAFYEVIMCEMCDKVARRAPGALKLSDLGTHVVNWKKMAGYLMQAEKLRSET